MEDRADNIAASTIGFLIFAIYMGGYAFLLNTTPLWVIITAILVMATTDFVELLRGSRNQNEH